MNTPNDMRVSRADAEFVAWCREREPLTEREDTAARCAEFADFDDAMACLIRRRGEAARPMTGAIELRLAGHWAGWQRETRAAELLCFL